MESIGYAIPDFVFPFVLSRAYPKTTVLMDRLWDLFGELTQVLWLIRQAEYVPLSILAMLAGLLDIVILWEIVVICDCISDDGEAAGFAFCETLGV